MERYQGCYSLAGFDSQAFLCLFNFALGIEQRYNSAMNTFKADILRLRDEGKTYAEIVSELGCSKGTVAYYCGADQKSKMLSRQRDRRNKVRKFLQEHKQASGCVDCKEMYPYWILELDHCRGEAKVGNVSEMIGHYSFEDIMKEVEKCDVVCANCHRQRTWERMVKSSGEVMID